MDDIAGTQVELPSYILLYISAIMYGEQQIIMYPKVLLP
jgi:hypothetical protein